MVPTSPPIGAPPEDAFLKAAGPNVDPDDNQRVATEEASISEQTVAIPDVDIEDDQRGAQDVFDETQASGAAAGVERELVQTFKTIFICNGDQFSQDLLINDGSYFHFLPETFPRYVRHSHGLSFYENPIFVGMPLNVIEPFLKMKMLC